MNIAVILYGSNWTVVKETGMSGDPWVFSSLRFLVAAAAFSPFLFQAAKNSKVCRRGQLGTQEGAARHWQSGPGITELAGKACTGSMPPGQGGSAGSGKKCAWSLQTGQGPAGKRGNRACRGVLLPCCRSSALGGSWGCGLAWATCCRARGC